MVRLTSFQKTSIAICFNLRQVCPSVPSIVFALLLTRSYRKVLKGIEGIFAVGGSKNLIRLS